MTIGTEVTLAAIIHLVITIGGIIYAWADSRGQVRALEARLEKAEGAVRDLTTRLAVQQEAFGLYREQQARELVSREILREVETRITSEIRDLRSLWADAISNQK